MNPRYRLLIIISSVVLLTSGRSVDAGISTALVQRAVTTGDDTAHAQLRSVVEAITFSLMQSNPRTKVVGKFMPYLDLGYRVTDVDELSVQNYTTTLSCPSYFHNVALRGGIGLPFGFNVELGFSQTLYDHYLTGSFATLTYQLLDFSPYIYLDLVPAMTVSGTVMRSFSAPEIMSFTGQGSFGFYNRVTNLQLSYLLQYTYSVMTATEPYINKQFIRHGTSLEMPIWEGLYVRNELFLSSLSASVALGYQF